MPFQLSRLRRWFAVAAVAVILAVAVAYFYSRHRLQNALREVPGKIGLEIQQSAQGFTVSKSEEGHTLFKIQASKAIQYKQGGLAELHDVQITVYGHDSSRYDQVYGSNFEYNPRTGDAIAEGEVQIDLQPNPAGAHGPDQSPPKKLTNPIHLVTRNLVFHKNGDAYTNERVTFSLAQASGSAVGVSYIARSSTLTLQSDVRMEVNKPAVETLIADRAVITKNPHLILLQRPRVKSASQNAAADQGTLFLHTDNTIERLTASGSVSVNSQGKEPVHVQADQLDLLMAQKGEVVQTAILSGTVRLQSEGPQLTEGRAGRAVLNFSGKNILNSVHAEQNVSLVEHQKSTQSASQAQNPPQDIELQASGVDCRIAGGRRLNFAETVGPAQILIHPTGPDAGAQLTTITAGKFQARFNPLGQLASVHGAPNARIVNRNPGQPEGVSTSNLLDAAFAPQGGIQSIVQTGNVAYTDGQRKAWGERARYTPADQILTLTGNPRVADGGMTTTARTIRLNHSTGDAFAEGRVKTTYSDLKSEPNGALLASGSPIHVTARAMTAHRTPAVAFYTGAVRLWQDANVVEAPSIEFDRDHRSVIAEGSTSQRVSTVLVQTDKQGKVTPVTVTSARLTYADDERKAHFEGNVIAKGDDYMLTARQMDVFLQARGSTDDQRAPSGGKIDRIVALGQVVVAQPKRRASGDRLVYTAAEDKFVMTGGPPSIFDAEQGKITGVSLTFYEHDDRVLVEGSATSPSVTETRVAR
jgi:lipopolysaccharide export system protein LptA